MSNILYADLETYSPVPIANGTWAYAEKAEILLFGYAIDDEPAKVWDVTTHASMPEDLRAALDRVSRGLMHTVWHNGMMFDTVVLDRVLGVRIPPAMVIDTRVVAYQAGLPGALGQLCEVLNVDADKAKDKAGAALVQLFCKPLPKNYTLRRATRLTHPEKWASFVNYCRLDVEAERELWKKLPKFNCEGSYAARELENQEEDARINRRGMLVDTDLAVAAVAAAKEQKVALNRKLEAQTLGRVATHNQRDALISYFRDTYHVDLDELTKAAVEAKLDDPSVPEPMKEMLRDRLAGTRTSVQKYRAILKRVSADDRMRGNLQFRGAARTGRFSGCGFQPQNLPRPKIKSNDEVEAAIAAAKDGVLGLFYDDPGEVLQSCIRGCIVAPEGKKLCVADYSNVEGRVLAWLAGESWKLQAFRDFDAGRGHDLYKLTYARTFGVRPEDVTKAQRQMGKVLELALGYGGGAGAFATFARGYGVDLHGMADSVEKTIDPSIWRDAERSYETYFVPQGRDEGLDPKVFIACDAVKRAWRLANPHIVRLWYAVGDAVKLAIGGSADVHVGHRIGIARAGSYLLVRLPSGRRLAYPSPRLSEEGDFSYMGVEQFSRKWTRIKSYGPKLVENIVQATSCDLLTEALLRLEPRGYEPVLHIHDEIIAEAPADSAHNFKEMEKLMAELPPWAEGLPLVAAGFEANRYRKD